MQSRFYSIALFNSTLQEHFLAAHFNSTFQQHTSETHFRSFLLLPFSTITASFLWIVFNPILRSSLWIAFSPILRRSFWIIEVVNRFAVLGLIGNPKPLSTLVCCIRSQKATGVLRVSSILPPKHACMPYTLSRCK